MKNILAIGAHYDDVELGVGGTLAKLKKQGCNVYKLTLTDNVTKFDQMNILVDKDSSLSDSHDACTVLGINEIIDFEQVQCNKLEYNSDIMQRVEKIIFDLKIDTVFIHYYEDMNQDHVAASKICLTAARYCKNIFMFNSNCYVARQQFSPTVFFDISDCYQLKKKALACYRGDHNRFGKLFDTVLKKNVIDGYSCRCDAAEGFVPVKVCL